MSARIVIPVRDTAEGKTRLSAMLAPGDRLALNRRFYRHVLGVALSVAASDHCLVISRDPWVLEVAAAGGAIPIFEQGDGLNPALEQAAATVGGKAPLLTLSTDLPLLGREDLAALLADADEAEVVAACDSAGVGTNALLLRRPGLIPYRYGERSIAAHRAEAERAGLGFALFRRPGLELDIDTPADLQRLIQLDNSLDAERPS